MERIVPLDVIGCDFRTSILNREDKSKEHT